MTQPCTPAQPGSPQASSQPIKIGSLAVRAISIVPLSTLAIFLIFLSSGHIRLSQSGQSIVMSLVYTALIALPSMFLLTTLSIRYTEQHPRLIVLIQALVLVCTSTAGTAAGALVLRLAGLVPQGMYWEEAKSALPFALVISLIFGLSISFFETLRYKLQAAQLELRTRQVESERTYKLMAQAQLSSLESRIHPHFLFNTLNSIASLIPSDPARAEDTVGKLASLLRFSLNSSRASLVPLRQELAIVRDYLEIERTRFGDRLRYSVSVPEALMAAEIPPLALQSLVENAVKHAVSPRPQGAAIQITGWQESKQIRLAVLDDGPGFSLHSVAPDHGLGNLIARLELLYGQGGELTVTREDEKTSVTLCFPAS